MRTVGTTASAAKLAMGAGTGASSAAKVGKATTRAAVSAERSMATRTARHAPARTPRAGAAERGSAQTHESVHGVEELPVRGEQHVDRLDRARGARALAVQVGQSVEAHRARERSAHRF